MPPGLQELAQRAFHYDVPAWCRHAGPPARLQGAGPDAVGRIAHGVVRARVQQRGQVQARQRPPHVAQRLSLVAAARAPALSRALFNYKVVQACACSACVRLYPQQTAKPISLHCLAQRSIAAAAARTPALAFHALEVPLVRLPA